MEIILAIVIKKSIRKSIKVTISISVYDLSTIATAYSPKYEHAALEVSRERSIEIKNRQAT